MEGLPSEDVSKLVYEKFKNHGKLPSAMEEATPRKMELSSLWTQSTHTKTMGFYEKMYELHRRNAGRTFAHCSRNRDSKI
jgi:hypothetical protein